MDQPDVQNNPAPIEFGFREEWADFTARHPVFVQRMPNIEKALNVAFLRTHLESSLAQRTIYFLGSLIREEFLEILLLSANGYGIGAQKLLRGMYERAVIGRYLYKHPEEADDFLAYKRVDDRKLMIATRDCMPEVQFSPEQIEQIEKDFQDVKERFMVRECSQPPCRGRRLNYTWSKKDFVSMARESHVLYRLLSYGYYLPTREIHSTVGAIFSRLDADALGRDEQLIFDSGSQRTRADEAIIAAHIILLDMLELQQDCFKINELEPLLRILVDDFKAMNDERAKLRP
jgi:Family of unknown function (DUF5677)